MTCLILLAALAAVPAAGLSPGPDANTSVKTQASGENVPRWTRARTVSFDVWLQAQPTAARQLAQQCEDLRAALGRRWSLSSASAAWAAPCVVVVYADMPAYLRALGVHAAQTNGAATVQLSSGRVVSRRIDLVASPQGGVPTALGHELMHVLLADRFPTRKPPAWAEEGMAVLADPPAKRALHAHDLRDALRANETFAFEHLCGLRDCPCAGLRPAFYGQSASLVEFFLSRGTPERFIRFLDEVQYSGYDAALHTCYGIAGTGRVGRLWQTYAAAQIQSAPSASVSAGRADGSLSWLALSSRADGGAADVLVSAHLERLPHGLVGPLLNANR